MAETDRGLRVLPISVFAARSAREERSARLGRAATLSTSRCATPACSWRGPLIATGEGDAVCPSCGTVTDAS